jgi:Bacterial protein of unknown function (DUF839)
MKKTVRTFIAAGLAAGGIAACGDNINPQGPNEDVGSIEIALTSIPTDVGCLHVSVAGTRTTLRTFDVAPGVDARFSVDRLPIGITTVDGRAFASPCAMVTGSSVPSYVSEMPASVRVDRSAIVSVLLKLIRNGRLSVGIDFENGPEPYLLPSQNGVIIKDFLTVGDSVGGYKLAGIPDGQGAFDNGDGTFTLLVNHELVATRGAMHAHGAIGAFVSKWIVRKSDLTVLSGSDLINRVFLWDAAASAHVAQPYAIARLCSADLPPVEAFYNAGAAVGFNGRIFMSGEETGSEGKVFAHLLDGSSYELPRLGKFSWENAVAAPGAGVKTVVAGLDDGTGGQVYFYVGDKTASGSAIERAGLMNGRLFGLRTVGITAENAATGIPSGTSVELVEIAGAGSMTGAALDVASNALGVTNFIRPEDGAFDPTHPNDFYFVTTASFTTSTRLWRLRFADITNPTLGGTLDMLIDGAVEGGKMFDNMTIDRFGHVYLQEDIGGQDPLGKLWRYDIATDRLTEIAYHNPVFFQPGAAQFLTRDEESSGIIDASDILGQGWFLVNVQAHYNYTADANLVEGGQLLAIYDPASR